MGVFSFVASVGDYINDMLRMGAEKQLTDNEFIEREIERFKRSKRRKDMIDGDRYYRGDHDVLFHRRQIIGEDGKLVDVDNLPNNRIVDNQYKKMVDQKINYIVGQPFTVSCEDEEYVTLLQKNVFNAAFYRFFRMVIEDALNGGVGWIYPYYDEEGAFRFKRFKPHHCIPLWKDEEHTMLDGFIRIYPVISYSGKDEEVIEKVEVYDAGGITYFTYESGSLVPCDPWHSSYLTMTDGEGDARAYNWAKIPIVSVKYNNKEIPLIRMVKSLQDGINSIKSMFQNNMQEDARNSILVLVNYDGENLGEFRQKLSTYGAVKVRTVDGAPGDLKTLTVEVNCENYKAILELFKTALIENAMGYDAKDDRLAGAPNQMNIQSMYSDIDLDSKAMELELTAALEELLWFVDVHFYNLGFGDFDSEEVDITFNRDVMMNETERIDNFVKVFGTISDETALNNMPWVEDVPEELDAIKKQKEESIEEYQNAFASKEGAKDGGGQTDEGADGGVLED